MKRNLVLHEVFVKILSDGQSSLESKFSVNEEILQGNLKEKTVSEQLII